MSCNCKKRVEFEETYGVKENETFFRKCSRFFFRIVIFLLLLVLSIIIVPTLIFMIIYQFSFKGEAKITLPKFLGKYMKD